MSKTLIKNSSVKKLSSNLSLVSQQILSEEKKVSTALVHHFFLLDVSGSMYRSIPLFKQELKNKLPSIMKNGDKITIIYFSGKGECGVLVSNVEVRSLLDFNALNSAIDKLHDIGLTGFKEPLDKTLELIKEDDSKYLHSLFFLTDGHDNSWKESEILSSVENLKDFVSSAIFVEYGNYANKELLIKMAETIGGTSIYSRDFYSFIPIFEEALTSNSISPRKTITLTEKPKHDLVISIDSSNNVIVHKLENDSITISDTTSEIYYLLENSSYDNDGVINDKVPYAMIYALSQRSLSDSVQTILSKLGDIAVIDTLNNSFTPQDYSKFEEQVLEIVKEKRVKGEKGFSSNYMPADDAFCMFDLLKILSSDTENLFYPGHPSFNYNLISSPSVQLSSLYTDEEKAELADLTNRLTTAKLKKELDSINERMNEITSSKFTLKKSFNKDQGFSFSNLVFHKSQANVSIQITRDIVVSGFPKNEQYISEANSREVRNYALIQGGKVNVSSIPVSLSKSTFNILKSHGLVSGIWKKDKVINLDLSRLTVMNRSMTKAPSASRLLELELNREIFSASEKVLKFLKKSLVKEISESTNTESTNTDTTNTDTTMSSWLESFGVKPSGFNPKTKSIPTGDSLEVIDLDIKIKNLSSIGSPEEALAIYKSGDLTKAKIKDSVMFPEISRYLYTKFENDEERLSYIENRLKDLSKEKRDITIDISLIKFAIILGKGLWFSDLPDRTVTHISIPSPSSTLSSSDITAKIELSRKVKQI